MNKIIFGLLVLATLAIDVISTFRVGQDFWSTGKVRLIFMAAMFVFANHLRKIVHPSAAAAAIWIGIQASIINYFPGGMFETAALALGGLAIAAWAARRPALEQQALFFAFAGVAVLQELLGAANLVGFELFPVEFAHLKELPIGTIGNPTLFGPFILALLPVYWVAFRGDVRWIGALATIILALATGSAATVATLFALLGVLFIRGKGDGRRLLLNAALSVTACVSAYFLLAVTIPSWGLLDPSGRGLWYQVALDAWAKRPLIGVGFGGWEYIAKAFAYEREIPAASVFRTVHSDWLQLGCETGIIGLGIGAWMTWAFYSRFFRGNLSREQIAIACPFIVMSINALVSFPFHSPALALIALVSWAMTVAPDGADFYRGQAVFLRNT